MKEQIAELNKQVRMWQGNADRYRIENDQLRKGVGKGKDKGKADRLKRDQVDDRWDARNSKKRR